MPDPAGGMRMSGQAADILVAGAGATGLMAAIAFARAGRKVVLVGKQPPPLHGRTVALFEGSLLALDALGLADALAGRSAAIRSFRIVDDTGSVFAPPPAIFEAADIGLDAFGQNISNDDLVHALAAIADGTANLTRRDAMVAAYDFATDHVRATLDDGATIDARLVVAADGHASPARKAAGIETREWAYPQVALTALLRHRRTNGAFSTEFHTRSGPFTFVPMPPLPDAPHRSSLVWLMTPEEGERRRGLSSAALAREIEDRSKHWFGSVEIEGKIAVFPMRTLQAVRLVGTRLLLVGEAAHAFPPLAAQGLNLGIRDVADAVGTFADLPLGDDATVENALRGFEESRRTDIDLRTRGVDLLNRSLLTPFLPADMLRGAALAAVTTLAPLRRAILSEGIMPALAPIVARRRAVRRP